MTTKSGVRFADQINGRRVVRAEVRLINGQRVRFHAIRKWNQLYWTCDVWCHFGKDRETALAEAQTLDIVEG